MKSTSAQRENIPALAGVADPETARKARNRRRIGLIVFVVIIVLACLGFLGPRDSTTKAHSSSSGISMKIVHPQVMRSGLDSQVEVTVERSAGLGERVVLVVDAEMYERLGIEQVIPAPSAESARGDRVHLAFDPVHAQQLTVTFEGRLPTHHSFGTFTYSFETRMDSGSLASDSARTWVMP